MVNNGSYWVTFYGLIGQNCTIRMVRTAVQLAGHSGTARQTGTASTYGDTGQYGYTGPDMVQYGYTGSDMVQDGYNEPRTGYNEPRTGLMILGLV